jgi:hypothetical protein
MEDLQKIKEFFSKPLNEEKEPLDIIDLAKVVKAVQQTGHPVTVLLVPKFNEIEVITGMDAPDDMLRDLSIAVDSLGYGRNDIIIAGDSSNLSRREYSDIRRVNGGAKDYFEEAISENDSYARVSKPRFVKDKNNPNFLNVYIDYDLGPGGSSIALGKETMTGQIRRATAIKAKELAFDVARDLKTKYNLEDIDVQDLENGKIHIFAVSDDFIDMDPNMLSEAKKETGVDMAKKQLDALGVKYEMSKTDKVRPFKVIYQPINKSDEFYDKFEDIVDLFNLKGFVKSSIKENNSIDYTKLISLIKSANNPRNLPIYYNSDNGVVNIGGVGYDKGELVKMFNSQPGQSLDIKNLFYKANQNPEETKNAIESMDPSIKVEIGYGYGNEPFVKYIKSINEANGFTSGKQMINIKLQNYPKAVAKINQLINMIGESNFTMEMAEWIFDFFNNASFEQPVNEATKEYDPDQAQLDDEDEIFMPYDDKGRPLEEAYVPSNIKDFAKRKGISSLVNKVAGWVEKVGKRITGGTAIGYNYSTLILDMEYQGSEIRINTDNDTIELYGEPVRSFNEFQRVYIDGQDDNIEENVAPNHTGKAAPYGSGYKPLEEKISEALDQINEELCPAGKAYIKRRKAAGEKSSAYLSGRAVKVCKGQMSGKKKK